MMTTTARRSERNRDRGGPLCRLTTFVAAMVPAPALRAAPPTADRKDYTDAGKAPNRTPNLALRVDRSSGATLTSASVEVTRAPVTTLKDIAGDLPKGQYVFFLKHWYESPDGPVYRCASPAKCVVGVNDGALETLRDPEAAKNSSPPRRACPSPRATESPSAPRTCSPRAPRPSEAAGAVA
ncbi:hypothetical protein, partial [Streptomyces sp. NPDC059742]|uniref:hypothetical protein n=1 Tax=Streptomyces sp. NPDC059742 TaxID=3346927 RepID=UPI003651BA84